MRIDTTPDGTGSDFIVSENGPIMTAYHVVRDARAYDVVPAPGGQVLNLDGEVVGLAVAASVSRAGLASIAAPIFGAEAGDTLAAIEDGLARSVPFLGSPIAGLQNPESIRHRVGSGGWVGRLITTLVQADVILAVDCQPLSGADDLVRNLRELEVGVSVKLEFLRGADTVQLRVTLGARSL